MSNSEKGTKNSGTQAISLFIVFTKTKIIPAARHKNVELISSPIGGSHDPKVGTLRLSSITLK